LNVPLKICNTDFNAGYLILERTFTCHYLIRELDAKDKRTWKSLFGFGVTVLE